MKLAVDGAQQWELLQVVYQLFRSNLSCYNLPLTSRYARDSMQHDRLRNNIDFFRIDMRMILLHVQPHSQLSEQSFRRCIGSLDKLLQAFEDIIDDDILLTDICKVETGDSSLAPHTRPQNGKSKSKFKEIFASLGSQKIKMLSRAGSTSSLPVQAEALRAVQLSCSQPYAKLKFVKDRLNEAQERRDASESGLDAFIRLREDYDYAKLLEVISAFAKDMRQVYLYAQTSEDETIQPSIKKEIPLKTKLQKQEIAAIGGSTHLTRQMIQSLHGSLTGHLVDCHSAHKARLYLPAQENFNSVVPNSGISVDVFLSTCTHPPGWQGARCVVQSDLNALCQSRSEVRNLCHTIKQSRARRQALRLLSVGDSLHNLSYPREQPSNPSQFPSISLRSLLNNGNFSHFGKHKVSLKEKRVLAVVLAHLMLQLCGGPWIPETWDASKIYFLYDPAAQKVINLRQPYIDSSLSSERGILSPDIPNSNDGDPFHKYPLILDFARLLVEIQHGETMEPTEEDCDAVTLKETPDTTYFMVSRILDEISDDIFEDYKSAIEACLDWEQFLPPGATGTSFEDSKFRDVVYQNIVAPLEEELFNGFRIKLKELNPVHPQETRISTTFASIQISSIDSVPIINTESKEIQGSRVITQASSFRFAEATSSITEHSVGNSRTGNSQTRVNTFSSVITTHTTDSFRAAIICPMGVEMAPVLAMLDKEYQSIPQLMQKNKYILGQIGGHNVVVTVMPEIGNNSAATVVTQLTNDFRSLKFGLLVGIGGGIPDPENRDIRLGDIVVSKPTATFGGAVQFDRGKLNSENRFERTGHLNKPPRFLRSSLEELIARHKMQPSRVSDHLAEMIRKHGHMIHEGYVYQGRENDVLYRHDYPHEIKGSDCKKCNPDMVIKRSGRVSTAPKIHYGTIGSANIVVKDGETRERLKQDLDVICIEMEAAGLMDDFPCLIVRGVCDYADSHKTKRWQPYAAATAAAFAKEFLSIVPPEFSV